MKIPDNPSVDLLQHSLLSKLSNMTDEVRMLDRKSLESERKIREAATKLRLEGERQEGDETGMYAYLQPPVIPSLDELVGYRTDLCWPYVVSNHALLRVEVTC
jgi:hypothetical protein